MGVLLCAYVSERGLAELSMQRAAKRKLLAAVFAAVFADESWSPALFKSPSASGDKVPSCEEPPPPLQTGPRDAGMLAWQLRHLICQLFSN